VGGGRDGVGRATAAARRRSTPPPPPPGTSLLALGRADGRITLTDPDTGATTATVAPAAGDGAPTPRGLAFLPHAAGTGATRLPLLVAASESGGIRLFSGDGGGGGGVDAGTAALTLAGKLAALPSLTALATHAPTGRAAAVAAKGEVAVYDLGARGGHIFRGKGDKPDRLGLVHPPSSSSVVFLDALDPGGRVLATGTARGRVRLYDSRHGQRPAAFVDIGPKPVTALAPTPTAGGACVWAGDASGLLRLVDLGTKRPEGVLKGATGGVACVAPHPGLGGRFIASTGVDGFLRVHAAADRKQAVALYMKQPAVAAHWAPAPPGSGSGPAAGDGAADADADAPADRKRALSDKKGKDRTKRTAKRRKNK